MPAPTSQRSRGYITGIGAALDDLAAFKVAGDALVEIMAREAPLLRSSDDALPACAAESVALSAARARREAALTARMIDAELSLLLKEAPPLRLPAGGWQALEAAQASMAGALIDRVLSARNAALSAARAVTPLG